MPTGKESCQRLAQSASVVPSAATQPSGRRGHAGGSEASISMTATPVSGEYDLGKDAEDIGNGIHRWPSPWDEIVTG